MRKAGKQEEEFGGRVPSCFPALLIRSFRLFASLPATLKFIASCVDFKRPKRRNFDVRESRHHRFLSFASLRFNCLLTVAAPRWSLHSFITLRRRASVGSRRADLLM